MKNVIKRDDTANSLRMLLEDVAYNSIYINY